MAWGYIAFAVIALFVYTRIPKPQAAPRPGLGEIQAPTADPSRDIPVIFGTVDLNAPNTVWYGDLRTVAIKEKTGGK